MVMEPQAGILADVSVAPVHHHAELVALRDKQGGVRHMLGGLYCGGGSWTRVTAIDIFIAIIFILINYMYFITIMTIFIWNVYIYLLPF